MQQYNPNREVFAKLDALLAKNRANKQATTDLRTDAPDAGGAVEQALPMSDEPLPEIRFYPSEDVAQAEPSRSGAHNDDDDGIPILQDVVDDGSLEPVWSGVDEQVPEMDAALLAELEAIIAEQQLQVKEDDEAEVAGSASVAESFIPVLTDSITRDEPPKKPMYAEDAVSAAGLSFAVPKKVDAPLAAQAEEPSPAVDYAQLKAELMQALTEQLNARIQQYVQDYYAHELRAFAKRLEHELQQTLDQRIDALLAQKKQPVTKPSSPLFY